MAKEVIGFDKELEERVKKEFGNKATPEFINLLRLGKAAYEHGYFGFIPKERVMRWVSMIYDGGRQQKRIREGREHGKILINNADVMNAAAYLDSFGKKEGYLSDS